MTISTSSTHLTSSIDSSFWCVIPAAGIGQRMQSSRPKQYLPLNKITVLEQTLSVFLSLKCIKGVVVAINANDEYWLTLTVSSHPKIHTVIGGKERSDSVLSALDYLTDKVMTDDWVLVHDAARPCIDHNSVQNMITSLQYDDVGGILGVPSSDTLKKVNAQGRVVATIDRESVWQAQTPQMFRYPLLKKALKHCNKLSLAVTDEASAIEAMGLSFNMILGTDDNIKITHSNDLWLAETLLSRHHTP